MHLFLIRHGRTATNVHFTPGTIRPVTESIDIAGVQQAHQAADTIAGSLHHPELIISSPYTRTVETTQILADTLHIPVEYNDGLRENSIGDWDGIAAQDLNDRFSTLPKAKRYCFRPPNGESWLDVAERFLEVISWAESQGYRSVVLVSHESPIRAIVSKLTNVPYEEWDGLTAYPPGSVTELDI